MEILLRKIRFEKDISLRELEKITNVPRSTLSNIENSHVNPKVSTVCKIAKSLNCDLDNLIDY